MRCNSGMFLIMSFYQLNQECSGKIPGSFSCISTAFRRSLMGPFFLAMVSPTKIHLFTAEDPFGNISPLLNVFPDTN